MSVVMHVIDVDGFDYVLFFIIYDNRQVKCNFHDYRNRKVVPLRTVMTLAEDKEFKDVLYGKDSCSVTQELMSIMLNEIREEIKETIKE